jgi:hypothetical protein
MYQVLERLRIWSMKSSQPYTEDRVLIRMKILVLSHYTTFLVRKVVTM